MRKKGLPPVLDNETNFPFIAVSPECPNGQYWNAKLLMATVKHVMQNFRVDASRIYGTGFSMGGYGIWEMSMEYPELFAAIIPICGGGDTHQVSLIKHIPQWVVHNKGDNIVPVTESKKMIKALEKVMTAQLVYSEYLPHRFRSFHEPHDSWTETYDNPMIYSWLLSHRKGDTEVQSDQTIAYLNEQINTLNLANVMRVQLMNCATYKDEVVKIVGTSPQLGEWDIQKAVSMYKNRDGTWSLEVIHQRSQENIEFKYIITNNTTSSQREEALEPSNHRSVTFPSFGPNFILLEHQWEKIIPSE